MKKILLLATTLIGLTVILASCGNKEPYIAVISKGFQHKFWVTVRDGAEAAAKQNGVKISFVGPETESDSKIQQDLLDSEINKNPDAIAFAAVTGDFTEQVKRIKEKNIPLIGFDSGILPDQAQGAVLATASTDNRAAAAIVADKMFEALKERIATFTAQNKAKIAVLQLDNSDTGIGRAEGFVKRFTELADGDAATAGKYTLQVIVPTTQNEADIANEVNALRGKSVLGIYLSNEAMARGFLVVYKSAEAGAANTIVGDAQDGGDLVVMGFDSGKPQLDAIRNGIIQGSVTQDPYSIGFQAVTLAVKASKGEPVANIDTGAKWYDKTNIDDPEIAKLLYE
ncbi:LacI family transcriptional regulator [Brachyspira hampsonii]|uniref:LacI family transcriptional regulator n=1 Tax=Brachyspira hampsonii TaxID=1287055 RepID=A0A1E5NGZ2_9SPIR|nr:ABC transporter substrate-binding protein [Brachyspira hampsonii]OEJ15347.1 LacI family transcriptional regulator [Brachyspira hampsonii]